MKYYKILGTDGKTARVEECSPTYELSKNQEWTTEEEYDIYVDKATNYRAQTKVIKKNVEKRLMIRIDNYTQNVERFYKEQPFFHDKTGIFWFWKNNRYEQVDEVDVMNMLDDTLGFMGQTVNSKLKNHYLEAFRRVGRKNIPEDAPNRWIQFQEKAYSIRSGKIYDVQPNYFFTNPIPWPLGESEDTPILDKLFEEWVGKDYVETLYELVAYCCYSDYPIQLLFCLFGSGRNGKGCFLRVLDKFIGTDNVCSTSLDLISGQSKSRFESFRLYKKLVALMGETNFGLLSSTSLIKQLTGGDKIGFEKKGKDPFSDYNYAKMIIASNSLPITTDTSDGFFRRWLIIDFPNEFSEGKDIVSNIPDIEYINLGKKVMDILPKLLERCSFSKQGDIKYRRKKYILASNPLSMFIKKCCNTNDFEYVAYNELYTKYIKLLNKIKRRRVSRKEFKAALEDEGYWVEKESKDINHDGNWKNGYWVNGLSIILDNLDNYTENPTSFLIGGDGIGLLSKMSKLSKIQEKTVEEEPIFTIINLPCTNCGSKPSHIEEEKGNPLCETCYRGKLVNKP